jgi:hypothetical protein
MANSESTKQIASRIDERTKNMQKTQGDYMEATNKRLDALECKTERHSAQIAKICGIGAAVVFVIGLAELFVHVF